jgi:hypothetical protein
MDEIEQMVSETFNHFNEHFGLIHDNAPKVHTEIDDKLEIPDEPGLLYHIQKSTSVFVIRTLVSKNIREDYFRILEEPVNYPSLRLLEGGIDTISERLRFFVVGDHSQAEIIHDQLCNRRFPMNEEMMCNLSDPGFSWWLSPKTSGFQLAFTLSVGLGDGVLKLGPLGDQQLALRNFNMLQYLISSTGLSLNIQNEVNKVQFSDGDEYLIEELKDLFEFGVLNEGLQKIFKLMAQKVKDHSDLETIWFYFQEVAALRRFWIQIQYDINS